ncbi:MAG: tRNA lysidine(34) synthetase TilS [Pirellulaceae bacterium]|nr:tRNA lysidine(34) synthetase TilS [Pirellulaceae bacterium]
MSISDAVQQPIIEVWPPEVWCDVTVLAAVSGGPDSVALLRALVATRRPGSGRLIVAHFNHRLRGEESDEDERFVRRLSEKLGLACDVSRAASAGQPACTSSEDSARRARYAYLCEAAARHGARYVATGHTADDQAETVLHRLVRGTGIGGLAGIRRHRELMHGVSLIRPMLAVRRSRVLEYLAVLGQDYRRDSSNLALQFTRNRLRHDLIPRLESDYNARLVPAIGRLAAMADEVQEWLDQQVNQLLPTCVELRGTTETGTVSDPRTPGACPVCEVTVDCRVLQTIRPLLVRELFVAVWRHRDWPRQAMDYAKWDELALLAQTPIDAAERRQHVLPGGVIAQRVGHRLTLDRPSGQNTALSQGRRENC